MVKYFKIFIISMFILNLISCANKDQDSLILDAQGGNTDENNTLTEEIEITENSAQVIQLDEVELTVEEKLASELTEVGDRIFFAGEATAYAFSTVHGADRSGVRAVTDLFISPALD